MNKAEDDDDDEKSNAVKLGRESERVRETASDRRLANLIRAAYDQKGRRSKSTVSNLFFSDCRRSSPASQIYILPVSIFLSLLVCRWEQLVFH